MDKRMTRIYLTIAALLLCTVVWASARYPFEQPAQQAQFQALLHDLRCPVCQNQDLADSNAALAADLRDEVYRLVLAHHSDQEIIQHLSARYGDFIVFKPPVKLVTTVLWLGPVLLLLMGLGLFAMTCIRRGRHE